MSNEHWHCMKCDKSIGKKPAIGDMLCEECKGTENNKTSYYHARRAEWRLELEKRVLTEKVDIAVRALKFIERQDDLTYSRYARMSLSKIDAIEEISK